MLPAPVSRALETHVQAMPEYSEWSQQIQEATASQAVLDARLRSVILHDGYGRVQVIAPESGVIDLEELNSLLKRELQATPVSESEQIQERLSWPCLPVFPVDKQSMLVVDPQAFEYEWVYIPSDKAGKYLKFPQSLFGAMMESLEAKSISCAVKLPKITVNHSQPDQDLNQITEAIESFTSLRIQKRLEDTLEMPPLPETAKKIINLRVDPNAGVADLSNIVELDPSLAAQVVSWASSSFYAAPGKIRSCQDAIVRVLGFDLVMNLAMGLALGRALDMPKDGVDGHTRYWEQAVWVATFCGALNSRIPREKRPESGLSYLCGLLHNYGYLVLAHVFPPHFSKVCRAVEVNAQVDPENCEHHLLGITREQIGSSLMRVWSMPEEIVAALRFQKNPYYTGEFAAYSALLFVVTQLLRRHGIGDGPAQPIPQSVWEMLGIEAAEAEEVLDELLAMKEEMEMLAGNLEANC